MNALLDTNILLWWLADDAMLPNKARETIASSDTAAFVSAASCWEISIKEALGRLEVPGNLLEELEINRFDTLSINPSHAIAAGKLPAYHLDPFDRILIAQAQAEDFVLITADRRFSEYEVRLLSLG